MRRAIVRGTGHYLPERVVENSWFEGKLDTSDEWIRARTGIERRHFAAEDQRTSDLGILAGKAALENAGIPVDRFPPAKDFTDTQLALQKAAELFPDAFLLLTGAFGGRFDHTLSTVLSLSGAPLHGCLCDEQEVLFPLKEKETITLRLTRAPKAVSLLPLTSECQGVTISGVRWPLHDVVLRQLEPYAVSNELSGGATITVKVHTGILGVYLFWETA